MANEPKYVNRANLERLYDNIKQREVQTFDTVADMQAATWLESGMTCHTNGFHASGDGGAAYYAIGTTGTANGMDVLACAGSLVATLVRPETGNPMMYGAYGDDTHDDSAVFTRCLAVHDSVFVPAKTYLVASTIEVGGGKTIDGPEATIHGTASVVMQVQNYVSSQDHDAKPSYIKGIAFKGNGTNVLLSLHNALKVSVVGTRYYDFATALRQDTGYELFVSDFRAVGSNATAIGIDLSSGDSIINDVMMRDVHTAIRLQAGHGRFTFNNVHCWILEPDYFEDSCMFDTSVLGGRDCVCNNFYFDTYHKPIIKRGLCLDVFNNPVNVVGDSVATAAGISSGTFVTFVEDASSFDKNLFAGKIEINGYVAQIVNNTFYTLTNDTSIPFKFTFGTATALTIQNFINEVQSNLYELDEDVTVAAGRIDLTPEFIVLNCRINLPDSYTSSSSKHTITFNSQVRFEPTTTYGFTRALNSYCTVYANLNYINITPAATGSNTYVLNMALPYNFKN